MNTVSLDRFGVVRGMTSAQQDEMRKEYDSLPKDAILRAVFMDWVGMRDADRACLGAGGK